MLADADILSTNPTIPVPSMLYVTDKLAKGIYGEVAEEYNTPGAVWSGLIVKECLEDSRP